MHAPEREASERCFPADLDAHLQRAHPKPEQFRTPGASWDRIKGLKSLGHNHHNFLSTRPGSRFRLHHFGTASAKSIGYAA
jgi:hypothetical protein